MFKFLRKRKIKGQSTLEYAVLIIIIIGALLSIQVYIKRGLQARYHDGIQFLGAQTSDVDSIPATAESAKHQYEPYYLDSSYDSSRDRVSADDVEARGLTTRELTSEKVTRAKEGFEQSLDTTGAD